MPYMRVGKRWKNRGSGGYSRPHALRVVVLGIHAYGPAPHPTGKRSASTDGGSMPYFFFVLLLVAMAMLLGQIHA